MFASQKLLLGKLAASWAVYPQTRRQLLAMPSGKPILVTGTHRSGTTWFGSMLAASGIWHVHEPFAPYKGLWHEWFSYAKAEGSSPEIDRLMRELLAGRHKEALQMPWVDHALMPLRLLPQPVHRVLIKDPIACLMSEYLTRHFDMETFVLFRHPAAFVESVNRLGWPQCGGIDSFLANEEIMGDFLHPFRELMESVSSDGEGVRSAAVMHGCLNRVLWDFVQRNDAMHSYLFEDLCELPMETFQQIFGVAGLSYGERIREKHLSMCFADTDSAYRTHEVRRSSNRQAHGWREHMSGEDMAIIREVWEAFDIPLYRNASDWSLM
ncbi:MAG: hypothetical protein COW18_11690 [Zetaproteobacteria bacterium CG12_big_fil_rev_8_21_14_0_65_54_13]|nr:MAG: hypothetical protein COW18_11690 [Zetaproteobacteria bacterium CG12_big_fil_rev_8_21_14_0_65_54_13]